MRKSLSAIGALSGSFLAGAEKRIPLAELVHSSGLGARAGELHGRSVLILTRDQLNAALALVELDGVARRMVVCPSDFRLEQLPAVIHAADVDAIVSDEDLSGTDVSSGQCVIPCGACLRPANDEPEACCRTEWLLLTSGTTGIPKLVVHTLDSLAGAITPSNGLQEPLVWSTFYDIRRYGGLQIFLRAILTGASLVLSNAKESIADFLARAAAHGVTHISGTPSHWRRALMSSAAGRIAPHYIRLSGEIADQAILTHLRSFYPDATVVHAFASTEAGVAFEVADGLAGIPASLICRGSGVEIKVQDGSLRIRSKRVAERYLGRLAQPLRQPDGFVDTGDMVELCGDRYYFVGRRDGVINVGGLKVHPEEVEAVINQHPDVRMSLVRARKNSITGALVVADIVLNATPQPGKHSARGLQKDILLLCRKSLPAHKMPAAINFVPSLAVAETGKLVRPNA